LEAIKNMSPENSKGEKAMADLSHFVPQLPYDTLAQFEATSGLMFLNMDSKTFMQSCMNYAHNTPTPEEIELFSTINHETYHYLQTVATGYQYSYASEVWRLIVDEANTQERQQTSKRRSDKIHEQEKAFADALKKPLELKRILGFQKLVNNAQQAREWENAAHSDLSLLTANFPKLARRLDQVWDKIKAPNADGLSALDLIEGSAIIFEHLLTHGSEGLEDRLAKAWDTTGETYRRSFDIAQSVCGPRALDIVLPATALSLRYKNPPEAYLVFLKSLSASTFGHEISEARAIASKPPRIPGAGKYLGTALDVRKSQPQSEERYAIYDDVLNNWETHAWDFDEIELLSDPGPVQRMGQFTVVMVVNEGPFGMNLSTEVLVRRLMCSSIVLRTAKLPRYRRVVEKHLIDRIHPIIGTLVDPLGAADEYNLLGLKYLEGGDTDQAELMMECALSIYCSQQYKKGIARQKYNLGLVYAARNERERAQETYRESLAISEEIQEPAFIAQAAANLGHEYMQVRRIEEAEALIRKALAIEEGLGLKEGMAIDYTNLGKIAFARKDFGQARNFLTKSAELYRAIGNNAMAESIENAMTEIGRAQGQGQNS
jgi:tetratricopeptide (TPR) repeat protein